MIPRIVIHYIRRKQTSTKQSDSPIKPRTEGERDAYVEGQRAALRLAREKGIDYAERIVALSHAGDRRERQLHDAGTTVAP